MTNRHFALMGLVGGALAIAGSMMPWVTIGSGIRTVSYSGIDGLGSAPFGNGVFSLGLGAVIMLASFMRYGVPSRTIPLVARRARRADTLAGHPDGGPAGRNRVGDRAPDVDRRGPLGRDPRRRSGDPERPARQGGLVNREQAACERSPMNPPDTP